MRVLAIDPQKNLSKNIIGGLAQEGFLLDQTANIRKALWMAKTIPYDLIFLSITNQTILTETAQKLASDSSPAFLVGLLPYIDLEKRVQLFDYGLDEIVTYPCYLRELLARIRSLTRREKKPGGGMGIFRLDDLTIEPDRFAVRRGSREIYLRRKEFDLLLFFFRHQDKILSKVRILEGVWDSNSEALNNTLEVHILKLRRKIDTGAADEPRLIHTVYGRGYLFGLRPGSGATPNTGVPPLN
jgi:DNA-binding response OmpR family regulator